MSDTFKANGRTTLIGSLPYADHIEANRIVDKYSHDIPIWVQLPVYKEEGMVVQIMPGMPGLTKPEDDLPFLTTDGVEFDDELIAFYEDFINVTEAGADLKTSRFKLDETTARGFFVFCDYLKKRKDRPFAVKGHVTGPFTFSTSVKNEFKRAVFYDEKTRDTAIKMTALRGAWQVEMLKDFADNVIIFFDEPSLSGFGSSEFISISKEDVEACFTEAIAAVKDRGGLTGIHVCANTEWSLILESEVDIVNFDAYGYFDRFILYKDSIKNFLDAGKTLAWGLVPTLNPEFLAAESTESLVAKWEEQADQLNAIGYDKSRVLSQTLITPSCGAGSLSPAHAEKALKLTYEVAAILRDKYL